MRGVRKRGEARGRGGRWAKHRGNHAEPGAGSSRRAIARGFFSVLLEAIERTDPISLMKRAAASALRFGFRRFPQPRRNRGRASGTFIWRQCSPERGHLSALRTMTDYCYTVIKEDDADDHY